VAVVLLGLLVGGLAFSRYSQAKNQFREMLTELALPDRPGGSVFRVRLHANDRHRYHWQPLYISPLYMPEGPLPGQEDYKIKALAVVELKKNQRIYFRLRANDGVSVLINHERVFDEWHPVPMGIIADFTEELCAGLNLLEVDYYLGHRKGALELRVVDAAGTEVPIHPLSLEVDAERWQDLLADKARARRWLSLGVALGLLGLLLPPVWLLVRNPWLPGSLLARVRHVVPGFWLGFGVFTAWRMGVYLGTPGENDLRELLFIPLLGGVAGAMAHAAVQFAPDRRHPNVLPQRYERARAWYLARENWLAPLLFFGALLTFMSWVVSVRGGVFPDTWLHAPWDALQYKDIMVRGYVMNVTDTGGLSGNFAWHPLLPWLARGLFKLGLDPSWALLTTAWLASATAITLLFRLARDLFGVSAARWTLAGLICYPGSFYLLIGYPYGTAIALAAAYFLAIRAGRVWLACLLGVGLGLVYPTAVLTGLFALFIMVPRISRAERPWAETRKLIIAGAGPALGLLILCLHHWAYFNSFFLPFTAHANWNRRAQWPWDTIMEGVLHEPPMYPEAIVVILIVAIMAIFAHRFHPALWAYLVAVFMIGPATGALESVYRQYLMAWPLFMLMASSPRGRGIKACFLWLGIYFALTWYIPLWLTHDLV
jgi:hypothetical protein